MEMMRGSSGKSRDEQDGFSGKLRDEQDGFSGKLRDEQDGFSRKLRETPADEYEAFVRARTPALLRSAYLLTGDQHLAEDLVQEALARTHRAWSRLHDTGNIEAYTRKVMYHTQVSRWRRRRVAEAMPGDLPDAPGGGSGDHASSASLRVTLARALQSLSPRQRAVVVLRFFEDRSEAEAAELLGVTVGTIKSQTARALDRLRVLTPELRHLPAGQDGVDQ